MKNVVLATSKRQHKPADKIQAGRVEAKEMGMAGKLVKEKVAAMGEANLRECLPGRR